MGQVLEALNRPEEALQHYESARRIEPNDVRSFLNIGRVLTDLHRYKEAEEIYQKIVSKIIDRSLESITTLFKKRRLQHSQTKGFDTIDKFSQGNLAIAYTDGSSDKFLNKGGAGIFFLLPNGSSDIIAWTRGQVQQEIHVTPSHLQLFLNLASLISQNASRLEEADAIYKKALMLRSDFTKAYLNRGDDQEAEAMYHRALEYDDTNPDLYFNLGVVLMDQGRNSEALEFFNKSFGCWKKIIDRGKETERMYINLGLIAVANKNFPSAEKWFRKALQKDPNSREALFNLALLLSEQHRQAEAVFPGPTSAGNGYPVFIMDNIDRIRRHCRCRVLSFPYNLFTIGDS
ncbi:protein O-mannosyl-transferase Tmtc3 [Caerostris extrusa]|uniref:Protein O-mannosyl-transferase Tmtc3 n=1 Tax=Caerostris extrusa TaxID=172846 RepID=A0AAV4RLW5_CAEEX|nr:protein O-mannosyl-transferase Tmtc3 [Caerostris extrusa]